MSGSCRPAVLLGLAAALAAPAIAGPAPSELSDAYRGWFVLDPSVTCTTPDGRDRRCGMSDVSQVGVHRNPADTLALVFVAYLPDPTAVGDATQLAAAAFRRDAAGWHLLRTLPVGGSEPAGPVAFAGGFASYRVTVPRPGDPRCCPTGRRQVSLDLR